MIPEQDRNSLSAKWLINKVEVLSHQIIGAECPGFTFIDSNGKSVSLKDSVEKLSYWISVLPGVVLAAKRCAVC